MTMTTESAHAKALMQWVRLHERRDPRLALFHHIPNGGARSPATAARLKAEGVRKGVPDYFLPVPAQGRHGLYIELKADKGAPSPEQREMLLALAGQGYRAVVCKGWEAARDVLQGYLAEAA